MKIPCVTKEQVETIATTYPTPFHIYDEKVIRQNAKRLNQAFVWNKVCKEFFVVKATPNLPTFPFLRRSAESRHQSCSRQHEDKSLGGLTWAAV